MHTDVMHAVLVLPLSLSGGDAHGYLVTVPSTAALPVGIDGIDNPLRAALLECTS